MSWCGESSFLGRVGKILGKSTREALKIMAEINPEMKKTKVLTYDLIENEELRNRIWSRRFSPAPNAGENLAFTDYGEYK